MPKKSLPSLKIVYPESKTRIKEWTIEITRRLRAFYTVHCCILFGSYAANTYSVGSDVDLLIVYDTSDVLPFEKALTIALDVSTKVDWEIHLYSLKQFINGLLLGKNDFFMTILDTGIEVYCSDLFKEQISTRDSQKNY